MTLLFGRESISLKIILVYKNLKLNGEFDCYSRTFYKSFQYIKLIYSNFCNVFTYFYIG